MKMQFQKERLDKAYKGYERFLSERRKVLFYFLNRKRKNLNRYLVKNKTLKKRKWKFLRRKEWNLD